MFTTDEIATLREALEMNRMCLEVRADYFLPEIEQKITSIDALIAKLDAPSVPMPSDVLEALQSILEEADKDSWFREEAAGDVLRREILIVRQWLQSQEGQDAPPPQKGEQDAR